MPGVPFSKACETCKKRRVKCDELKPSCTPCLRLNKGPCPGYRHESKFIDEAPRLEKKRVAAARHIPEGGLPTRTRHSSRSHQRARQQGTTAASRWNSSGFPSEQQQQPPPSRALTKSPRSSHVPSGPFRFIADNGPVRQGFDVMMLSHLSVVHCGRLRGCLDIIPGWNAMPRTIRNSKPMPSYVWYLPSRIGSSRALDSAVDLTLTAAGYLVMPASDPKAELVLMKKLGVAVAALTDAISDPKESMSAEVLAAVSLLSAYECIKSTSQRAWMNHYKGLYMLLEKRGPSRYKSDFERQCLIASIGVIFTISMRGNFPCFLEQPEWQDILANKPADSIIAEEWTDSYRVLPLMCLIPRALTACRDIVRNRASQTPEKIEALVASTHLLRASFLDMADKHGWTPGRYSPVLAPRNSQGDDWRVFNDEEDQRSANYANHLSALIMVDRILFALRPSAEKLEQEARASALEIQYLHMYLKAVPRLRKVYIVHAERVGMSVLLTSAHWTSDRSHANGNAFDPMMEEGGNIIEQWKFDAFDDILSARTLNADLMLHYPQRDTLREEEVIDTPRLVEAVAS